MIYWVLLPAGFAVAVAAVLLTLAMVRAERRARRRLYRALGLGDRMVELLMARNGDVLAELTLLRKTPAASEATSPLEAASTAPKPSAAPEAPPDKPQPAVHPVLSAETRQPPGQRRQPYVG